MKQQAIAQHHWERQAKVVQAPKPADKPREEQKQQNFLSILKKQSTEDRITTVLSCLAIMFGAALVVTQIGIFYGW